MIISEQTVSAIIFDLFIIIQLRSSPPFLQYRTDCCLALTLMTQLFLRPALICAPLWFLFPNGRSDKDVLTDVILIVIDSDINLVIGKYVFIFAE